MARFDAGTTIKRPVEDVFAVLSDFSNGSKWASGVAEPAKKSSAGPIGVGTTWHGVGKPVGRIPGASRQLTVRRRPPHRAGSDPTPSRLRPHTFRAQALTDPGAALWESGPAARRPGP